MFATWNATEEKGRGKIDKYWEQTLSLPVKRMTKQLSRKMQDHPAKWYMGGYWDTHKRTDLHVSRLTMNGKESRTTMGIIRRIGINRSNKRGRQKSIGTQQKERIGIRIIVTNARIG